LAPAVTSSRKRSSPARSNSRCRPCASWQTTARLAATCARMPM